MAEQEFGAFVDLLNHPDYEILNTYPFTIRKKSNQKILSESIVGGGYIRVVLNGKHFKKHRLIAEQFIPNPLNLPFVDHKNRIRTDNRVENLRWVTHSENDNNKTSFKGINYVFVDEIDEDSITVTDYGNHEFEDYYYDEKANKFYFWNGIQFRELYISENKRGNKFVSMNDTNGKKVSVYYSKFKKLYDLV